MADILIFHSMWVIITYLHTNSKLFYYLLLSFLVLQFSFISLYQLLVNNEWAKVYHICYGKIILLYTSSLYYVFTACVHRNKSITCLFAFLCFSNFPLMVWFLCSQDQNCSDNRYMFKILIPRESLRGRTRLWSLTGCGQGSFLQPTSQAFWNAKMLM